MSKDLKKIRLDIKGMHCASCEVLIERKFRKIDGVEKATVSHASGKAELLCSKDPDIDELGNAIKEEGYAIEAVEGKPDGKNIKIDLDKHLETGAVFLVVLGAYFILREFDLLPKIGVSENMGYSFVFVLGLIAAMSTCLAVTGGLLLAIAAKRSEKNPDLTSYQKFKPHVYFNIGRIASYTLFGGIIGVIGSMIAFSPRFTGYLTIFVSAVMIILGLQMLNIFPWLRYLTPKMPKFIAHRIYDSDGKEKKSAPFLFGASTFFLPCGFTQALQLYVLTKGSFAVGALTMLFFSLGTMPALVSLGALSSFTKGVFQKYFIKASAVVVILLGVFSINNGFALAGSSFDLKNIFQDEIESIDSNVKIVDGRQIVEMKVVGLDYFPSQFNVLQGIPIEWMIDGTQAQGCAQIISVPQLGITEYLPQDRVKTISFTPGKAGNIRFSCSMGMAGPGVFNVAANTKGVTGAAVQDLKVNVNGNDFAGEAQKVYMEVSREKGFYPNSFNVKKGVPVELEVDTKLQLGGCMGTLVIPDFDVAQLLKLGKNIIRFVPDKLGVVPFTCSMGSRLGQFVVTD